MTQKLKTDLFRFVTLRSPKLLDADRRRLGFVAHPDPLESHFLEPIVNVSSLDVARTTVQGLTASFSPLESHAELKAEVGDVWDFSMWLSKYARTITPPEVAANLPASSLSATTVIKVWDQVYYDLLTKENLPLRQACLQVLVAQHFIEEIDAGLPTASGRLVEGDEQARQRRLAQGKVIVHPAFTPAKKATAIASPEQMEATFAGQEASHEAMRLGVLANRLMQIGEELSNLRMTYQSDYTAQKQTAYANYVTDVEAIVAAYETDNPNARTIGPSPEDGFPPGLVPPFEFAFAAPLSATYTDTRLSAEAETFLDQAQLRDASPDTAIAVIEEKVKAAKRKSSRAFQPKVKEAVINGVLVRPAESAFFDYTFSLEKTSAPDTSTYAIFMSLNTGKNGVFVRAVECTVELAGNDIQTNTFKALRLEGQTQMIELYAAAPLTVPDGTVFPIEMTMELSDGRVLNVNGELNAAMPMNSGFAVHSELLSQELPSVQHHGVKSLGVADYRRVEQELCCYVAGEVSHVENILAREYKEKTTRNLTSSERILETVSERETEDLSDTVATGRNEMSTEVAEVINRDRRANFGFNAGVSGEFLKQAYNASAYGDFAFGQSSSKSNAVARTYAEDVTRRALERVMQRTSVRRSARVLQEFEENTQQGFDNRDGTQHVTGVYRWLDKVYKNTLVNYGKRMMYEFVVPEPARFYKQAVIVKAKEEQNSPVASDAGSTGGAGVSLKPSHPSEFGVSDASDISRSNYSTVAAAYGATVTVPQDEFQMITGSFGEAIDGYDDHSFTYNSLVIPPDYACIQVKGSLTYYFHATAGKDATIKTVTGGRTKQIGPLSGKGTGDANFLHLISPVSGQLTVNVTTKKIRQFNLGIEAKARLRASLFEQWQQDTFHAIMGAYNEGLQAYNDAQSLLNAQNDLNAAMQDTPQDTALGMNPKFNAQVVQTELKRLCIEILTQPFGLEVGADLYHNGPCQVPGIRVSKFLDHYGQRVKFFEQAFDWELMAYHFYPYYWAKRCHWVGLFQSQDSMDHIFQAFLQSGMARLVLPVREGFEDAVVFYLESGEIWQGSGMVIETDDEVYLSIADEMTLTEGQVEDSWETVVPSMLSVVQAGSVLLDEEGLPCCETDPNVLAARTLKPDDTILSRESSTN